MTTLLSISTFFRKHSVRIIFFFATANYMSAQNLPYLNYRIIQGSIGVNYNEINNVQILPFLLRTNNELDFVSLFSNSLLFQNKFVMTNYDIYNIDFFEATFSGNPPITTPPTLATPHFILNRDGMYVFDLTTAPPKLFWVYEYKDMFNHAYNLFASQTLSDISNCKANLNGMTCKKKKIETKLILLIAGDFPVVKVNYRVDGVPSSVFNPIWQGAENHDGFDSNGEFRRSLLTHIDENTDYLTTFYVDSSYPLGYDKNHIIFSEVDDLTHALIRYSENGNYLAGFNQTCYSNFDKSQLETDLDNVIPVNKIDLAEISEDNHYKIYPGNKGELIVTDKDNNTIQTIANNCISTFYGSNHRLLFGEEGEESTFMVKNEIGDIVWSKRPNEEVKCVFPSTGRRLLNTSQKLIDYNANPSNKEVETNYLLSSDGSKITIKIEDKIKVIDKSQFNGNFETSPSISTYSVTE